MKLHDLQTVSGQQERNGSALVVVLLPVRERQLVVEPKAREHVLVAARVRTSKVVSCRWYGGCPSSVGSTISGVSSMQRSIWVA